MQSYKNCTLIHVIFRSLIRHYATVQFQSLSHAISIDVVLGVLVFTVPTNGLTISVLVITGLDSECTFESM